MSVFEGLVVRRITTAQQVADGLSEFILSGRFNPGDRLRESAIATELGVARNTVREAVRILELSGLVHHEVNRGAVVISPTLENVDALYNARMHLETAAVSRPPTPDQLDTLRRAFGLLVEAAESHDSRHIVTVDLAFHTAIVAMMNSSRIDGFYAELTQELRYYLMVLSIADREFEKPGEVVAEHEVILRAIESGDMVRAADEIGKHIATNAARVREILAERG